MKYILALLLTTSAFAQVPITRELPYRFYFNEIDLYQNLDLMMDLIELAQDKPHLTEFVVQELQKQLNLCKMWIALQHD